jgi:hypothetical protein
MGKDTSEGVKWRLNRLTESARHLRFDSIFDAVLAIIRDNDEAFSDGREQLAEFVAQGGLTELLSVCRQRNLFHSLEEDDMNQLKVSICDHAQDIYKSEWSTLTDDPQIRKPLTHFTSDYVTSFSIPALYCRMRTKAPYLFALLENLGTKPDEFIGEAGTNYGEPDANKEHRRRCRHIIVAISTLAQLRSRHINVFQGILAYFLYANRVPKRVIMTLNHLGLTVSYSSLNLALKSNAESLREELKSLCNKGMAIQVSFDNLTAAANVRDERLHNKASYLTYTAGYVVEPPPSRAVPMFTRSDVNYSAVQRLIIKDFLPSDDDQSILRFAFRSMLFTIVKRYGKQHNLTFSDINFPMPTVDALDPQDRPRFHVLPTYDLDESRIDEIISIIYEIADDIGLSDAQVKEFIVMFKGDYMTVKNIRFAPLCIGLITGEAN